MMQIILSKMKKMYYKIMISSIYTAQNNGFMSDIWKFASSLYFAFATSIYMLFIYLILNNYLLENRLDFFLIKFTIIGKYNFILNMMIYFIVPIMILNHLLIFKNNQYKYLIKEYKKNYNKKIFLYYFIIAILFIYIILFTKKG